MPESTEKYHHIPIRDAGLFAEGSLRTIDISKDDGIKAVIGKLKSDEDGGTKTQKYLFDVEKWTMDKAKAWVDEHRDEKSVFTVRAETDFLCHKEYVSEFKDADEKRFITTHLISTKQVDRVGDRMEAADFERTIKHYKKNRIVLWAHNMDPAVPSLPIGKNIELTDGPKGTRAVTQYAAKEYDFARLAFDLYVNGYLNGWSWGFIPRKAEELDEKWEGGERVQKITHWDLLEYSSVPVPANQGAVRLMIKHLAEATDGRINTPAKVEGYTASVEIDKAIGSVISLVEKDGVNKSKVMIEKTIARFQSLLGTKDAKTADTLANEQARLMRLMKLYRQYINILKAMNQ